MSGPILYVTGTNTGVGKTSLAMALLLRAKERGIRVGAMKPFCSGGREDAERLHALQTADLSLDEVNPFHFDARVTPLVAARKCGRMVTLQQAVNAVRAFERPGIPLLIEGAGGLLSPLGEGFSLLEIMREIPGRVCLVAMNTLGVINQTLLTLRQLPTAEAIVVLINPAQPDESVETNGTIIRELQATAAVVETPWLDENKSAATMADQVLSLWIR